MEQLVVTLAHLHKGSIEDAVSRLRFIVETVRNAPGMMNARLYCGKGGEASCLMLTAWDNEEAWQKAQERYNPANLLLQSTGDLLVAAPEQWLMQYLWGYSRPAAQPLIAEAHLATVRPSAANQIARQWLDELRRQATSLTLAFAFLACGTPGAHEDNRRYAHPTSGMNGTLEDRSAIFLNLLSWPGEAQRKDFYADQRYRALQNSLTNAGAVQVLALEPA